MPSRLWDFNDHKKGVYPFSCKALNTWSSSLKNFSVAFPSYAFPWKVSRTATEAGEETKNGTAANDIQFKYLLQHPVRWDCALPLTEITQDFQAEWWEVLWALQCLPTEFTLKPAIWWDLPFVRQSFFQLALSVKCSDILGFSLVNSNFYQKYTHASTCLQD